MAFGVAVPDRALLGRPLQVSNPSAPVCCNLAASSSGSFPSLFPASGDEMILVVVLAELLQDYTAKFARALEQVLNDAPFPRRVRFLMLQGLPAPPSLVPPSNGHGVIATGG
ncbi:hypothetical protein PR202_gb14589 [Eleusine coracana subsp. coracana]|uniref:Uncharacterized protein n=1 Tax=Eleusine coracana subsp. coracana TaxID=191504 RepID=A0AAV5EWS8_ELECO|nr:hypothetical protein PR202_gb14589 [Eleusine coracana subsp. coracana]